MANEKQEIVLEIQVQGSIDNLAKLRSEMDALIKTRQDLSAKSKEGDIEATKEIEKLNSAVRNMQTEYKAQQRVLDGYNASVKTNVNTSNLAANSIQQNRDLLKQLTAQYIQLKAPSENATSQIKHLSDVLKEQESAIGNNTRNVGNYKEALVAAFSELKGVGQLIDPIKNMGLAFTSAGSGVKGFGAALATTGLPLIITGINLLIQAFSDFKPLAEAVENIMGGLSSVFSSSYSEGVKLVKLKRELEDADREQIVVNAELRKSINELEAIAAGKGRKDKERIDALEGANKLRIEQLKIEKDLAEKAKVIADKEVDDAVQSARRKAGLLTAIGFGTEGVVSDDVLKKQAEAQAKLIDLQDKFTQATTSNNNMVMRLKQSIEDDANAKADNEVARLKKLSEAKNKSLQEEFALDEKLLKEKLAALRNLDDERKKNGEKEKTDAEKIFNEQNSFLQKQLDLDLGYADLEVASKEEKEKRKQQILINSLEKQLDLAIQFLGADGDITKAEIQGIEAIRLKLKQAKADAAKPTPETYFESLGINQEALGKAEKTLQGFAQIVSSINDIVTKGFQIRENEIESQKNHEIEAVQSSTLAQKEKDAKIREINKQAAQEKYQLELQAFNTSKGIQIVQAIISTALAVVNGLNAGLSLGPAGVVMGPVLAALAGVTGAVQIALIASQQPPPPPQFAKGIIGLDGEGTETSDSIDARLSKGESVMTAKATRRFHRELAYMEMSVGNSPNYQIGRGKFASGFIPSPNVVTSDGGFAARDIARNADNSALIQNAIKNGFALAPAPVLSIVEFQTKQNDRNRSVNISEA